MDASRSMGSPKWNGVVRRRILADSHTKGHGFETQILEGPWQNQLDTWRWIKHGQTFPPHLVTAIVLPRNHAHMAARLG